MVKYLGFILALALIAKGVCGLSGCTKGVWESPDVNDANVIVTREIVIAEPVPPRITISIENNYVSMYINDNGELDIEYVGDVNEPAMFFFDEYIKPMVDAYIKEKLNQEANKADRENDIINTSNYNLTEEEMSIVKEYIEHYGLAAFWTELFKYKKETKR